MKNFMVVNFRDDKKNPTDKLTTLLQAQIENALDLGWEKQDIIILSNVFFRFMNIRTIKVDLNDFCFTGSKMFGIKWLYDHFDINDVVFSHDLDCWQNAPFDPPEFKDVGACQYSQPKFNGGSIFWRRSAKDIIDEVIERLQHDQAKKEEPALNEIFKSKTYKDRVTILNYTYNVGCSAFVKRYEGSIKPIKVCHFHPDNRLAWETHALDRNGLDETSVSPRLEKLVRKHYPNIATELSEDGKQKAARLRNERLMPK